MRKGLRFNLFEERFSELNAHEGFGTGKERLRTCFCRSFFFIYFISRNLGDTSINMKITYFNLINANPLPDKNLQINNKRNLEIKKGNMKNASSYFKLNGRPSIAHR